MKKTAITLEQVKFKQEEIKKILIDTLAKIHAAINPSTGINQISAQVGTLLNAMSEEINRKVLEMVSLNLALQQQLASIQQQPAQADDGAAPRGKKQNKNLPDFWRRNCDYGESPYMHMDKMKTITQPKRKLSKR